MKSTYIIIILLLSLIIPASCTVNWTYSGNESVGVSIDLINESGFSWAYALAMSNKSNATDFPLVAFATDIVSPWNTLFTDYSGLFVLIIWGVFMIMSYRSSGNVVVPAAMGVIGSGAIILLMPDMDMTWMYILLAASIAAILYTAWIGEE